MPYNCIIVLGPTAVGKTSLGIRLARAAGGEIISADSRQVYKMLDIGSGKDISDYSAGGIKTPYYLIDIADLSCEFSVFDYLQNFYCVFEKLIKRNIMPVIVGGTGMYIDAVIHGYAFIPVPRNETLRAELRCKSLESLSSFLLQLRPTFHTKGNLRDKERVIRAIEIAIFTDKAVDSGQCRPAHPDISPFIIGMSLARDEIRQAIAARLKERLNSGMIEEVQKLHNMGVAWTRLEALGLEYRYVSLFLQGKLSGKNNGPEELFRVLNIAIGQFAKRQETWFRGMERKGVVIHWLPSVTDKDIRYRSAVNLLRQFIDGIQPF